MRRTLALAVAVGTLTFCAPVNKMCADNEDGIGVACRDVFGYDYEGKALAAKHTDQIVSLTTRADRIELDIAKLFAQGNLLSQKREDDLVMLEALANSYGELETQTTAILNDISSLQLLVANLQNQVTLQLFELAQLSLSVQDLQAGVHITEVHDFCGDKPGIVDEVGIKLSNGKLLVYFEDTHNDRRLSVLTPGDYVTSDGSHCYFTISASGSIINEHY
jgi:hypothetical protein